MNLKKFLNGMKFWIVIGVVGLIFMGNTCFAAGDCAFSAGYGYGNVNMTSIVKTVCTYTGNMGYHAYYSTDGTNKTILDGYFQNGTKRLESDLIFLTGHGQSDRLYTIAGHGLKTGASTQTFAGTAEQNWTKVKLAVFLACNTGNGDGNLAYDVFKRSNWTTTSLGWKNEILEADAKKWAEYFYKKLATGATIDQSMVYAGSQKYNNGNIKDLSFFGNGNMIASKKSRAINMQEEIEGNIEQFKEKVKINDEEVEKEITEFMQKYNSGYKKDDFDISVYDIKEDGSLKIIDLTYKVGKFITNSQYSIIVENGYITQIADNTIKNENNYNVYSIDTNIEITNEELENAKKMARKEILKKLNEDDLILTNEKMDWFYDLDTNKKYIRITDTFGYKNDNNAIVSEFWDYEI